mmetsp:Transcript_30175/g.101720  ORF Transcript_30175/g.101720 Transcript_30175/m.101720 type:complete len:200 (+) Transcript_30175:746-1345(+)
MARSALNMDIPTQTATQRVRRFASDRTSLHQSANSEAPCFDGFLAAFPEKRFAAKTAATLSGKSCKMFKVRRPAAADPPRCCTPQTTAGARASPRAWPTTGPRRPRMPAKSLSAAGKNACATAVGVLTRCGCADASNTCPKSDSAYASARAPGAGATTTTTVPATLSSVPATIKRADSKRQHRRPPRWSARAASTDPGR